jgi:acylphosphatase
MYKRLLGVAAGSSTLDFSVFTPRQLRRCTMTPQTSEKNRTRAELLISGRVQGVFFRSNTRQRANSLGIEGYVRNRTDGRVEAVFEGRTSDVKELVSWCHEGPSSARVNSVDIEWSEPTGEFSGFQVRY